ncbi:MAG: hypothetical protein AAFV38_15295, partial [Pseudomonadota bacterium]
IGKVMSRASFKDTEDVGAYDDSTRLFHSGEQSASFGLLVFPSIFVAGWELPMVDIIGIGLNRNDCATK